MNFIHFLLRIQNFTKPYDETAAHHYVPKYSSQLQFICFATVRNFVFSVDMAFDLDKERTGS